MLRDILRSTAAAEDITVTTFTGEIDAHLQDALSLDLLLGELDTVILINFLRFLRGSWTGHWAVIGGVSHDRNGAHVLILDVAAHKTGPHWLPLSLLVSCICTRNSLGAARGYIRLAQSNDDISMI